MDGTYLEYIVRGTIVSLHGTIELHVSISCDRCVLTPCVLHCGWCRNAMLNYFTERRRT